VAVSDLTKVAALAAGEFHTCAVLADGTVRCWGENTFGQLGDGTTDNTRPLPVPVSGLSTAAVGLAAGRDHTCAVLADGSGRCWGGNAFGQIGDGTTTGRVLPMAVNGLTNAVAIAAGGDHTCARLADGSVRCWGSNISGQLGDGDTSPDAVLRGAGVLLRAERSGGGDGRVYHVNFRAEDGQGGLCRGEVTVEVPHNRKSGAVDGGALYDSTVR
jgi:alpha-tubulin suppressor-like RCC1 family protein